MVDKKEDHVIPDSKWEFDQGVTDVFENMLQRSIPQYDVMRDAVTDIACKFVDIGELIIDLGCSDGMAIERLWYALGARNRYYGVDVSAPMLEKAKQRFKNSSYVTIENMDLRWKFPEMYAGVIQADAAASKYAWVLTRGVTGVVVTEAIAVGVNIEGSTTSLGQVASVPTAANALTAGNITGEAILGFSIDAGDASGLGVVYLQLE